MRRCLVAWIARSADFVKETTNTQGTGAYALLGAPSSYMTFLIGVGNGNKAPYAVRSGKTWERGIGTVSTGSPPTISRNVILGTSAGNTSAINWPTTDAKDIWLVVPSEYYTHIEERPVINVSGAQAEYIDITEARRLLFHFGGLSTNGTNVIVIQIGDGSYDGTGYQSTSGEIGTVITSAFAINNGSVPGAFLYGRMDLTRVSLA